MPPRKSAAKRSSTAKLPHARLPVRDKEGRVLVVIDTPKGSRNKYEFDEELGVFALGGVLPAGASFPFDFGYVPRTRAEDGDPLDVLVLMDDPAFVGCVVPSRLVGAIEAEQTEEGETFRNDRLLAVAENSRDHRDVRDIGDLSANLLDEIEHFFASYNEAKGKQFEVLDRVGARTAQRLLEKAMRAR
ncbi:MAG TPA: inorganic diphosphatase [Gemmatimonadaceae bacterium]|nr:inorganic diphosphatase [Gemmatimonadaceae bacterium]